MADINYPTLAYQSLYNLENEVALNVIAVRKVYDPEKGLSTKEETLERKVLIRAERYSTEDPIRLQRLIPAFEEFRMSVWDDPDDAISTWREIQVQTGEIIEDNNGKLHYDDIPYYLCSVVDKESGKLIGFGYGWREKDKKSKVESYGMYAHFIGIDDSLEIKAIPPNQEGGIPETYEINFRNYGLADEIKDVWDGICVKEGLRYIAGTADPLLGSNSHIYFNSFSARVSSFTPNKYGDPNSMTGENKGRRTDRWNLRFNVDPTFNYDDEKNSQKLGLLSSSKLGKIKKRFIESNFKIKRDYKKFLKNKIPISIIGIRSNSPDPKYKPLSNGPYDTFVAKLTKEYNNLKLDEEKENLIKKLDGLEAALKIRGTKSFEDLTEEQKERSSDILEDIKYVKGINSSHREERIRVKLIDLEDAINLAEEENQKSGTEKELLFRIPFSMEYLWERNQQTAREWQILSAFVFNELVNKRDYDVGFVTTTDTPETIFPWAKRINYYVFTKKKDEPVDVNSEETSAAEPLFNHISRPDDVKEI